MKKSFITSLLFLLCLSSFSQIANTPQNWDYEVREKHDGSIKIEKLRSAKSMSDIMVSYPVLWITSYVSVELSATCDGKVIKSISKNEVLTEEQKNIVAKADLGSDVIIEMIYTYKNGVTNINETSKMHYVATVVPDVEAEYISGAEALKQYFKEKAVDVISVENPKQVVKALVKFTVNEEGEISEVKIARTSGDESIDKLLVDTINKMPKWKPATNANGTKVKQGFEFSLNSANASGC
jgi:TonB family protein